MDPDQTALIYVFHLVANNCLDVYSSNGIRCKLRVLDSRPRDRGLEPHRRHCVVSLSKTHLSLLSTGSTQEDLPVPR